MIRGEREESEGPKDAHRAHAGMQNGGEGERKRERGREKERGRERERERDFTRKRCPQRWVLGAMR